MTDHKYQNPPISKVALASFGEALSVNLGTHQGGGIQLIAHSHIVLQHRRPRESLASAAEKNMGKHKGLDDTCDGFNSDTHLERRLRSQIDTLKNKGFF